MSGSWDEDRRVAAIRAAQRAAEAQRYELEVRRLREESVERPPGPELEIDTGWPERSEVPDAPPVPHAMLRSSLRQAIASESWAEESTSAAALKPGMPQALPGAAPTPAPNLAPKPAPMPMPMPTAEPPHTANPGLAQHPDLSPKTSNEAALAFDIGMQEMAQPPAPPIDSPDDLRCDEDPVAVAAVLVDEASVPGRDPQLPLPPRVPAPRQQSMPVDAQPPAVPMPMPHEVAAAFDTGAREMTAPSAPPPAPVAALVPPRDPVPRAAPRSDDPTPAPAPAPAPMPTPNEVAAAFDAGAREMASPQARPPMPPAPVQAEAPAPPPSASEPRQPPPTPPPSLMPQPPAQPQPQSPAPPPSAAQQPPPRPPRDAATAFDAGVRQMASPPPRPSTPPPPRADAPLDEARAEASEPDRDDDVDERQSAQLALDVRLAQLTFKGIVTQGGG